MKKNEQTKRHNPESNVFVSLWYVSCYARYGRVDTGGK